MRDTLNIVVVGHVDHGKSTLIGRLLYDTDSLPLGTIKKVEKIAKDTGKPFEYAYLLDAFEEEQKQGITIDTTQIQFQTKSRDYVIIDAPGHKEFLKNMISGAANAEAALLIIDANEGVKEQSKRHAYILSLIGIKKVYVVLNKMDLVDYSEKRYETVKRDMDVFLKGLNINPLGYIPVSAYEGENITKKSEKLDWYKGGTIIESIDSIEKDEDLENRPLRFPIQDVYKFDNRRIIAGRIESGTLRVGDEITIYPEGKTTKVNTIEYWQEKDKTDVVKAGQSVGITVTDEFFNKRGEIITSGSNKPLISRGFRANIFWMGKNNLQKYKKYKIKLATAEVEGEVEEIIKVLDSTSLDSNYKITSLDSLHGIDDSSDKSYSDCRNHCRYQESNGVIEGKIKEVLLNDVAEVIIRTKEEIAFDSFSESSATGRFVIVDGYDVAGGGIIVRDEQVDDSNVDVLQAFYDKVKELDIDIEEALRIALDAIVASVG